MKRIAFCHLCFLIIGCGSNSEMDQNTAQSELSYFGFTLVDTYWDDPSDSVIKTNYIDEVAAFSNIADILVINPQDQLVERLKMMNAQGMKAILHLNEIFFEFSAIGGGGSGFRYRLRQDYKKRWDDFAGVNDLIENQSLIQILYLGEEPTWNGITFEELKNASDYLKETFPSLPVMLIEAAPAIERLQIPESVDWVGFDHYFLKDPGNDPQYLSELNLLKSKLSTEDQKLVFVMDAHYIPSVHGDLGGIELQEMKAIALSYYQLARSEPKAIALIGYFWPGGFDDPSAIGARNMPEAIKEAYRNIGRQIINR
ncbi:hypothetical protein ACJD0Z_15770 [Flavobacteriaceae bacterium M23B6Z8]